MNKKNSMKYILGASQILVVLVIALVFSNPVAAQPVANADPGMGDLQRFEGEGYSLTFGPTSASSDYVGMGDLHVFDSEGLVLVGDHIVVGNAYVGMGDLQAFESEGIVLPVDQLAA